MRIALVLVAGVIIIGSAVAVLATREQSPFKVFAQPARQPFSLSDSTKHASVPRDDAPRANNAAVEHDFEKELRDAEDYWEFAERALVEAKRDNGAAQYHLSLALSDCRAYDDIFFRDGNRRRTYDEAVQHAVKRGGIKWEFVADKFKRCKRLLEVYDPAFGTAEDWMNASLENGYSRAQAQAATEKAWKSRHEMDPDQADEIREEARGLALKALRSRDPGAMIIVGDMAMTLDKREGAENPHDWIWVLAACERGYDCSRQSMWYQFRCSGFDSACQPYENGMVDVVQRETGSRFPELQRRARELNEKLDQGRFDELGF